MKDKAIFSRVIAEILVERGFPIKAEKPNYRDPAKRVFYFKTTPELEKAFNEIVNGIIPEEEA